MECTRGGALCICDSTPFTSLHSAGDNFWERRHKDEALLVPPAAEIALLQQMNALTLTLKGRLESRYIRMGTVRHP